MRPAGVTNARPKLTLRVLPGQNLLPLAENATRQPRYAQTAKSTSYRGDHRATQRPYSGTRTYPTEKLTNLRVAVATEHARACPSADPPHSCAWGRPHEGGDERYCAGGTQPPETTSTERPDCSINDAASCIPAAQGGIPVHVCPNCGVSTVLPRAS